uniref:Endoglucanase n=1 Tax=Aegilops tauschii TaxID=37682 RepID=N1QX90_AEGTA
MRRSSGAAAWALGVAVAFFLAAEAAGAAPVPHDYEQALRKSLLYFEAQRSGRLPYGQRVAWRDHSGLTDGLEQGVDLVGGYYDAGDHVKFGLPMAFTVTMLSWSLLEYGGDVAAAGELAHALESIKWGTDYFIKAHTKPDELWAEVGDGDTDHYCWQRPEDMTTSRQAYKVDRERPGSDVAGETAAALAAASMAFRETNPHYAHLLLHHAQQLFEFADKYRGKYDSSIAEVKSYYASVSGYHDELLWAALWLHRATGRAGYLDYVVDNAHEFGGTGWAITEFSWDVKYAGVQILATRLLLRGEHEERHRATLEGYRAKAEHYVCACMGRNAAAEDNVERSPGGMLYVRQWNNMQYVTSAAYLLSVYSGYLTEAGAGKGAAVTCAGGEASADAREGVAHARAQVDYVLGSNPRGISYLVGYGAKFPARVHHRAASIVPYKDRKEFIGCAQGFDDWFGRKSANPNVVVGAIVGGPDRHDRAQVDYVLGSNPRGISYLVGYGAKFPARVHHRAASIVPYKDRKEFIGCAQGFDDWFGRKSANPNVVVGAIGQGQLHADGGVHLQHRPHGRHVRHAQPVGAAGGAPARGLARQEGPSPAARRPESSRSTAAAE